MATGSRRTSSVAPVNVSFFAMAGIIFIKGACSLTATHYGSSLDIVW